MIDTADFINQFANVIKNKMSSMPLSSECGKTAACSKYKSQESTDTLLLYLLGLFLMVYGNMSGLLMSKEGLNMPTCFRRQLQSVINQVISVVFFSITNLFCRLIFILIFLRKKMQWNDVGDAMLPSLFLAATCRVSSNDIASF